MDNTQALLGMAGLAAVALAVFAIYRWRQRDRVRQVTAWVGGYVSTRYGGPPGRLTVNCSDDPLWPVLVGFDHPATGIRHNLQFLCSGPPSRFSLLSEGADRGRAAGPD